VIKSKDLTLNRFIPKEELTVASSLNGHNSSFPRQVILLTGANGFLGRFLLLELLHGVSTIPADGGKREVVCIVRASNDQEARGRLLGSFGDGKSELRKVFEGHADMLTVYAGKCDGDKTVTGVLPRLAITAEEYFYWLLSSQIIIVLSANPIFVPLTR